MLKTQISLIKNHGGLILAGFLLYFFSAFGQSVFFGAYIPVIQADMALSKTAIGSLYAIATIASSVLIIFTGRGLDHMKLRNFLALTFLGLATGCFVMAGSYNLFMLFIAFLLLRQFGQGLPVLAAGTSINRYLSKNRGKASAMIALGSSFHIIIFPPMALMLENHIDWRTAWAFYGLFILFILLPGFWFYLRAHQEKTHARWEQEVQAESEKMIEAFGKEWTRRHVLADWRFYGLVAIIFLAPFIGTAIFFYQRDIAEGIGISPLAFAASFPFLTASSIISSFTAGAIIDKFGEKPVLAAFPLSYTAGLLLLTSAESHLPLAYAGIMFIGASGGMIMATGGPLLASLYGTKHLGSIKSMLFSTSILGSALSPFLFGLLMDAGIDILTLLSWCAYYTAVIWILAFPICKDTTKPAPV